MITDRTHLRATPSPALFAKTDSGSRWPCCCRHNQTPTSCRTPSAPSPASRLPKCSAIISSTLPPPSSMPSPEAPSPPLPGGKRINQVRQADAHARKPCRRERSSSSCVYIPTYARRIVPVKTSYMGVPIRTKRLSPSLRLSLAFKHTDPLSFSLT